LAASGTRRKKTSIRKKDKLANVKVGDIITVDEILGNEEEAPGQVQWLRGKKSPFEMDVLDCRGFALHHMSTSGDAAIAESFVRNMQSNGTEFVGTLPKNPVRMDVSIAFPLDQVKLKDGPVFIASQMEEKWNIYFYDQILYFVRSWTGILVHAAKCEINNGTLKVSSVMTNRESIDERDRTFPFREVFFLIVSHVLGKVFPHPIPAFIEAEEEKIALFSFSQYGRMGLFATEPGYPEA
jgi:hypothetical protein